MSILARARLHALITTLETVQAQRVYLDGRILAAEIAGNYAEADRLRQVADAARESADQYRDEMDRLTGQQTMVL